MRKTLIMIMTGFIVAACSSTTAYAADILKEMSAGAGKETVTMASSDVTSSSAGAGAEKLFDEDAAGILADAKNAEETGSVSSDEDPLEGLCVADVSNSMNVRKLPEESAKLAGYLYSNSVATVIEQKDGWTHLKSGDLDGWAKNDYLLFGDAAEERIRATSPQVAEVNTQTLRVRESADPNADITGLLAQGEEVEVVSAKGAWVNIEYEDGTEGTGSGYVSGSYVSIGYDFSEGETCEEVETREEQAKKEKEAEAAKAAKAADAKTAKTAAANRTMETTTTNNGGTAATVDDATLLAALVQCECGYESYEGQLAVAAVVVNRARGSYGSIKNAVYAPGQFGPASSGKLALVLSTGAIGANAKQAAAAAIGGTTNVGAATHFRNVRSGYSGIVIGNHVFW